MGAAVTVFINKKKNPRSLRSLRNIFFIYKVCYSAPKSPPKKTALFVTKKNKKNRCKIFFDPKKKHNEAHSLFLLFMAKNHTIIIFFLIFAQPNEKHFFFTFPQK